MKMASRLEYVEPRFTYGDYAAWTDPNRWELIEGVAYCMSPAPMRKHQGVSAELLTQIRVFLRGKRCKVYGAPFDVRLQDYEDQPDEEVPNVVQPDIVVVSDRKKLDEKGCRGGPDLVIEILSPSTASHDQVRKTSLYEKHGVREYWIVDPDQQCITVRVLSEDGRFDKPQVYNGSGTLVVAVLPELIIDLDSVFEEA
ncbi:MAG: Uma2 family endonuclease [Candidatus Sumerlaeota bacterium]|nr:Uma2 family endonuclease [Candidatus Sumerlaeota bacterium]